MTAPATSPVLEAAAWPGDLVAELRETVADLRRILAAHPPDSSAWAVRLDRALAIIETLEA